MNGKAPWPFSVALVLAHSGCQYIHYSVRGTGCSVPHVTPPPDLVCAALGAGNYVEAAVFV
jgi:hypothetical protein